MIIGISGKAQAGKDTIGNMLAYFIHFYNNPGFLNFRKLKSYYELINWEHKYFGLPLKQCLQPLLHCTLDDLNNQEYKQSILPWLNCSIRELLQNFGTGIRNTVDFDFWIKALFKDYTENSKWIITDVRFKSEAEAIKSKNGILIRVNKNSAGAGNHQSEIDLDDYSKFDFIIDNNGTLEDLFNKVYNIYIKIFKNDNKN